MTRCGHVFCFPCVMRLLLAGEGLRCTSPCPLCFAPVSVKDLRTLRACVAPLPVLGRPLRLAQVSSPC
jgi:hypothetical protein